MRWVEIDCVVECVWRVKMCCIKYWGEVGWGGAERVLRKYGLGRVRVGWNGHGCILNRVARSTHGSALRAETLKIKSCILTL